LALHQPVARDLRFVVAVLKINNDLSGSATLSLISRPRLRLTPFR
jgi:phosphate uptake regulator